MSTPLSQLKATLQGFASGPALCECLDTLSTTVDGPLLNKLASSLESVLSESRKAGLTTEESNGTLPRPEDSNILTRVPDITLIQPRGKFEMLFCQSYMCLANAKTVIHVHYADVAAVHILDNIPEERRNKVYLLLELAAGKSVPHGKKALSSLVFEIKEGTKLEGIRNPKPNKPDISGEQAVVLCTLFGMMKVTNFQTPDTSVFCSSARLPCTAAYIKASKGWLYPLPTALVYIGSPCMVVPHSSILGIDMPGADQTRRTFDLVLYDAEGNQLVDFSQVDGKDLDPWLSYMAAVKLKKVAGEAEGEQNAEGQEDEQDDEDDDSDDGDDDFDPSALKRRRVSAKSEAGDMPGADAHSEGEEDEDEADDDEEEDEDDEDDDDDAVEMIDEEGCTVADLKRHREKNKTGASGSL